MQVEHSGYSADEDVGLSFTMYVGFWRLDGVIQGIILCIYHLFYMYQLHLLQVSTMVVAIASFARV